MTLGSLVVHYEQPYVLFYTTCVLPLVALGSGVHCGNAPVEQQRGAGEAPRIVNSSAQRWSRGWNQCSISDEAK